MTKLGFGILGDMLQPVSSGVPFVISIWNPIREFNGMPLPEWRVDVNLDELAGQEWMMMIRMALVFMLVMLFITSVINTLRQS